MLLKGQKIAAALTQPDEKWRVILVYGPDAGLVHERCQTLLDVVLGKNNRDPFRYSTLDAVAINNDPARLMDEAQALSPLGRRAVFIRAEDSLSDAESLTELMREFLGNGPEPGPESPLPESPLIVLAAGDLPKKSKLRAVFAAAGNAASLPCYRDEARDLGGLIRGALAEHQVEVTPEALAWLVHNQGGDRLVTRAEMTKLALYTGAGGLVNMDIAQRVSGANIVIGLNELCQGAACGVVAQVETALARLQEDGVAGIGCLRAVGRYFLRLHKASCHVAAGQTPQQVVSSMKPPMFFKEQPFFITALRRWTPELSLTIVERLLEAEMQCKRYGPLAPVLTHRVLLSITTLARKTG